MVDVKALLHRIANPTQHFHACVVGQYGEVVGFVGHSLLGGRRLTNDIDDAWSTTDREVGKGYVAKLNLMFGGLADVGQKIELRERAQCPSRHDLMHN